MYKCKKKSIILKRGKKVPACLLASPNSRLNTDRQTQRSAAVSHTRTQTQGKGCGPEGSAGAETALQAAGFRHPRARARLSEGRLSVEEVGLAG